jgi:methylated-DNA-[protein]-cysteine S-methyltransferase
VRIELATLPSPLGPLAFAVAGDTLIRLDLRGDTAGLRGDVERRFGKAEIHPCDGAAGVASRLDRYFRGDLRALEEIAVDPGGTDFQRAVWLALRGIPAGRTCSYAQLALAVGRPAAVRAVGAANGANPIPLVLPCHRVIGSDGRLTGYGGGLDRKAWLLHHEGARLVPGPLPALEGTDRRRDARRTAES